MKALTLEEWVPHHRQALRSLSELGRSVNGKQTHSAGIEYTSLMSCFLMHDVSAAQSLLALYDSSDSDWFPVTVGFGIARTMFEVDVTAHYIAQSPQERARRYILFEHILDKREMDVCNGIRKQDDSMLREAMEIEWHKKWEGREQAVKSKFDAVAPDFRNKKGKIGANWSGKTIKDLAAEVDHEAAYNVFCQAVLILTRGRAISKPEFVFDS